MCPHQPLPLPADPLHRFGTSYDPLRSSIDALQVRFECFLVHARMTAEKGATLSDDMVDLLETISTRNDPSSRTEKRVEKRVEKLKRSCEDMIEECQRCKDNFTQICGLLYDVSIHSLFAFRMILIQDLAA